MDRRLLELALATKGFMPEKEGLALHEAGLHGARIGPLLEVGSYCGRSTVFLGAAAATTRVSLYSIDHHRGSEEHQRGEQYHDPELFDGTKIDTLPSLLATIAAVGLVNTVVPLIGTSERVAGGWAQPLGLVFIDGGHNAAAAHTDYDCWARHVDSNGLLVIHDVFESPADGGRPPYEIYLRAIESGAFKEIERADSMRVLERIGDGI